MPEGIRILTPPRVRAMSNTFGWLEHHLLLRHPWLHNLLHLYSFCSAEVVNFLNVLSIEEVILACMVSILCVVLC